MVSVRFTLTGREYATAIRGLRLRNRGWWTFLAGGAVLIALGAVPIGSDLSRGFWIGLGASDVWLFSFGVLIAPELAARKVARRQRVSVYGFSEESLSFEQLATKHTVGWSDFTRRVRARGLTALVHRGGLVYMIPDRAFDSPDDREQFVALTARQIQPPVQTEPEPRAPSPRLGPAPGESALERIYDSLRRGSK